LAARFLARPDASRMVMVGAGALAPFLIRAHLSQRPIEEVLLWNRSRARADALAEELQAESLPVRATDDLEAAVRGADLVSCATLSRRPLVKGEWLKPGAHLDLVGAFNLTMREADDEALLRSRLYVDTAAARHEGGDVALALRDGAIPESHVLGDLFDLCRAPVERPGDAVTVFKSVGAALEDLAAAMLVWRRQPISA
ncbi:MAG: ornithine cyclodeaminase family protein, partial [Microvirga sp.]